MPRADRERPRREARRRRGEIAVLFVGAFDRKGLATAIDAVARLDGAARSRLRLIAVGSGAREPYLARAARLGVGDRLVFAGYQKEVAACYRAADIFLFPTLYEPFGMVILEAMATGLPAIVSRCAGGAELIENGVSGLLLDDPADPAEIARALSALIADDAARVSIGRAARRVAEARSWDVVAREYAAVLAPLMGGA
ncbi:MAG: glycosyltransferase family 4 protein [Acidobacteria bacterium]|nr:glycosyltransferase family 4 protein [Acidobacteriota bacterium]